jgi:non-reducing end alpha-L-arabinofuranosidase
LSGVDAAGSTSSGGAGGDGGGAEARGFDADAPDAPSSGGTPGSGGGTSTGGATGTAGATGTGGSTGSGGTTSPGTGPCDIYAAASPGAPCVAAYSMVRVLASAYRGPLYQVRKGGGSNNTGTGGTTQDIGAKDGFADSAAQETFCGTDSCTVSILYDQSGEGNDLTVAKKGCATGTASADDYESSAKKSSLTVSGHKVYALYMNAHEGYRNNTTKGMPTGSVAQGIYEVVDGKHFGTACCWEFGNATTDNCYGGSGMTNALFFGAGYPSTSASSLPIFTGDFGTGPWVRDCGGGIPETPPCNPTVAYNYAMGVLKTNATKCAIRFGNAQSGSLETAYDGALPVTLGSMKGGIILGIGTDNSNSSQGTFFEGAITSGSPSNATDDAVLKNVQAVGYGN